MRDDDDDVGRAKRRCMKKNIKMRKKKVGKERSSFHLRKESGWTDVLSEYE